MRVRDITNPANLKTQIDWLISQVSDNCGTVTLTASATTTVVKQNKCTANSTIVLTPMAANSQSTVTNYYVVPQAGQFTITHNSSTATDRKFSYAIIGV